MQSAQSLTTMAKSKYFSEGEFARCTPPCKRDDMAQAFLNVMDAIREKAGIPLVINCAYRSVAHEKKQGRAGTSAHTYGLAVDIRCGSDANRWKIIKAAIECGVTRIGVSSSFIHIDISAKHTQCVVWTY